MPIAVRLLPIAFVTVASCKPDCPNGATDRHGYNCTPVPGETGETSTTADDTTSTSTSESSSSTSDSDNTTAEPCDDDPACGPGETPETCPEQCADCGDGILAADEACDNGDQNQTYWPTMPPEDACSETCTKTLEYCGDAQQTNGEPCDNGTNTDPPYSMTLPPDACAPGCKLPGYCGDADHTGEEACDDGQQTATCEQNCTLPTCGDGITNTPAGEACDDNNELDGDGCTADCKSIERTVFVTSAQYKGDLNAAIDNPDALSGLELADARCQQLAMSAGLTGNFKAWLSTTDESPATRFDTTFTGLYRLRSAGAPIVAIGWEELISGTLLHPIDTDENSTQLPEPENVWTNTLPDGSSASMAHCTEWTSKGNTTSVVGQSSAVDVIWTNLGGGQFCSEARRLYCFEDI